MTTEYASIEKLVFLGQWDIESYFLSEINRLRMNFMKPVAIVIRKEYYMDYCGWAIPERDYLVREMSFSSLPDPFLNDFQGIPFIVVRAPILEVIPDTKTIVRTEVL